MNKKAKDMNTQRKAHSFKIEHWHWISLLIMVYDLVAVNGAYFLALWLRFDCRFSVIPNKYLMSWLMFAPIYSVACLIVFMFMRLYRSIWRFASYNELVKTIISSVITGIFHICALSALGKHMPV